MGPETSAKVSGGGRKAVTATELAEKRMVIFVTRAKGVFSQNPFRSSKENEI